MDIQLTLKNYRCFSEAKPARINVRDGLIAFVGPNNAGKSSLLRFFYDFRPVFNWLAGAGGIDTTLIRENGFSFPLVHDPDEVFYNGNTNNIEIEIELISLDSQARGFPIPKRLLITVIRQPRFQVRYDLGAGLVDIAKNNQGLSNSQRDRIDDRGFLIQNGRETTDLAPVIDLFKTLADTRYIGSFRNAINIGAKTDYFDIQVGQAFIERWELWQTGGPKKDNEAAEKLLQEINEIYQFPSLKVMRASGGQTLQIFINSKSYKLHEVGSGLAQFVLVLANVAMSKPSFILIDEPELNLHPSLQLSFLSILGSYASKGVLFATHNMGLARASTEMIYSVLQDKKTGEGLVSEFNATRTPQLAELLGELNFSGYQDIGSDRILLVEGPHDVTTIQQFLRMYKKDQQIVILPLGGKTLIKADVEPQLREIMRLSNHIFALIDSECVSAETQPEDNRLGFKEVCERIGIPCHILKWRAIENYLTDQAVKRVFGPTARKLSPYEKLSQSGQHLWAKSKNWQIAQHMSLEELEGTDLGEFLKKVCEDVDTASSQN